MRILAEEAQFLRNGDGRVLVVARDHHGADARGDTGLHRELDLLPRRVDHRGQTDEGEVPLDRRRVRFGNRIVEIAVRHPQDAHRLRGHLIVGGDDLLSVVTRQRPDRPADIHLGAIRQQDIRRPLHIGHATVLQLPDNRHLLAVGIERQLVEKSGRFLRLLLPDARLRGGRQQRPFRRVADDLVGPLQLRELRAVAEHRHAQHVHQVRMILGLGGLAVEKHVPLGA